MDERSQRILVVDDDPHIVRLLVDCLKRRFDVVSANDGEAARRLLEQHEVAAVVADHMMPGLTGVELLRHAIEARPDAVRILVTASERVQDLQDAVNLARVHRFVQKPLRPVELPEVVASAIREQALERENGRLVEELREKNRLLTEALAQVKDHERRLEQEVAARTRELTEAMRELQQLALRDGLTGLYNHRFFQEALATELARAQRYSLTVGLIFLDVDHFKAYNDRHGHPAGDALLKALARVLGDTGQLPGLLHYGRASDVVARYGGEEFVIILPETDKRGALVRAERLRRTIESYPFERGETQPLGRITVSVGVAAFPEDAWSQADFIDAADQALLVAKRSGRNRVIGAGGERPPPEAAD